MTRIIKSSDEDNITIPARLMEMLNLREGDEIKVVVDGQNLRLTRLDKFLELRGALADDEDFDQAIELIERAWQSWTSPNSA